MNSHDASYLVTNADQIGQVLRGVRKELGLTQAQLARKVGLVQKEVSKLENSSAKISVERLFQFLSALELEVEFRPRSSDLKAEW